MTASALHDAPAMASANLGEYCGTSTASDFGDVRGEFQALIAGCGVYDLSWRAKISFTGKDRARWLNGMCTNNIRDLMPGHGVYAFVVNPQGHIQADLYAHNRGDSLLVDTDRTQLEKLLGIFRRYIIMDQVAVEDVSEKLSAVGLSGPAAREVLNRAGLELPQFQPLQHVNLTWRQVGLTLLHGDNPSVESFQLWLSPESILTVWTGLVEAGAKPVGTSALEMLRIASGVPRYGQDIRDRDLPQETGQQRALSFTKGCYIGQEIVERIRSRGNVHRQFTGFEIVGTLPPSGTKVQADGKEAGEITSAASLPVPSGERRVALGYVRREAGTEGKEVAVGDTVARVVELPFRDVVPRI